MARSLAYRRSRVAAAVMLGIMTFLVVHQRPAYTVKGTWEGSANSLKPDDYDIILKSLEPELKLPTINFERGGLSLSIEDDHLHVGYTTKMGENNTLRFRINEGQDWRAGLSSSDASLRVKGRGLTLDNVYWEASQSGAVDGVGDVLLEFNSNKEYNLTVSQPKLGEILNTQFGAKVQASNKGFTGRLRASKDLPGKASATYSVENPVGIYDLDKSHHVAVIRAPVAGGHASLRATRENSKQEYVGSYDRDLKGGQAHFEVSDKDDAIGYNMSYARNLADVLPVNTGILVGVDEDGIYSKLAAHRPITKDSDAEYEASVRVPLGGEDRTTDLAHALKLSNKFGFAQFLHSSGDSPRIRLGYAFDA